MSKGTGKQRVFRSGIGHGCIAQSFLIAVTGIFATSMADGADLSQAVVKEKVNIVTLAPNLNEQPHPAPQGAVIRDENVVRTGTESRAELEFTDLTLARLGSNSIFSFDAKARTMNFTRGAILFSKPTNSGPIQLKSGAVSGAITGSTGFISTVPVQGVGKLGQTGTNGKGTTIVVGMLEGKMHGGSQWTDNAGHEHSTPFQLGPGDLLVTRPGLAPRTAQFDLPRFVKSSPLIKGFKAPLPNAAALDRAVADYLADQERGFVDQVAASPISNTPNNITLVGRVQPLDVVAQIATTTTGIFLPVGSTGVIRAQLVWNTDADLDLYLVLPNGQVVSFSNVSVTFNNGRATAVLDHDNLGNTIDVPPNTRVENIAVNGIPLGGLYRFIVNNFNSSNVTDSFTLTVFYNGQFQVISGTLGPGQTSLPVVVQVPGGSPLVGNSYLAAALSNPRSTSQPAQRTVNRPGAPPRHPF